MLSDNMDVVITSAQSCKTELMENFAHLHATQFK